MTERRTVSVALPPAALSSAGGGTATPFSSPPTDSVHKKPNNLAVRTVTILSLGPLLFLCGMHSKESCTFLIFLGVFIAGMEWTGLKRHLKVELLLSGGNGSRPHELHQHQRRTPGDSPGGHGRDSSRDGRGSDASGAEGCDSAATPSLPASPPLANGRLLHPEEYALPVTPLSLYAILKHLGWAGLALAAYVGVNAFAVTLATYFLIFVCVTVMAHNRLERKVERATTHLSDLVPEVDHVAEGARNEYATAAIAARAAKKAQRAHFLSLELQMIAEKQPTEQFLDFCLDIFGVLWISGLVYPVFLYDTPRVGLPWAFASLLGNFCNDIMALVVGRSLKTIRQRYTTTYDLPHLGQQQQSERDGQKPKGRSDEDGRQRGEAAPAAAKRSIADAGPVLRFILCGPHPLYPAISPNKSLEGAIAGVVTNALVFCASMSICYHRVMPLPDSDIIAPCFNCTPVWLTVGFVMGVLGVVGDLLQSLLKRSARVKDAGFIVPGHGGILDRLDGCLLVFPFMFCTMSVLHALSA